MGINVAKVDVLRVTGLKVKLTVITVKMNVLHSQNKRAQSQHEVAKSRADLSERVIQDSSTINVTHKDTSFLNSSRKAHKKPQPVSNVKEQRFLNTILIIACIAVVTVLVGTVFAQLNHTILKERPEMNRIWELPSSLHLDGKTLKLDKSTNFSC